MPRDLRRAATASTATSTSTSTTAEREIFEIAQRSQKQSFEKIKDVLHTTIRNLEKRYEKKQAITGVPSGYHKIDAMTAGLQPGDLIIIAARPSMGKTSFVMNMAQNAAMEHQVPSLVFSLETSKETYSSATRR